MKSVQLCTVPSSGNSVVSALNDATTTGKINSSRLSSDVLLLTPVRRRSRSAMPTALRPCSTCVAATPVAPAPAVTPQATLRSTRTAVSSPPATSVSAPAPWRARAIAHHGIPISPVDGESVLQSIAGMPIESWNYREDPLKTRHLGPTAQNFSAALWPISRSVCAESIEVSLAVAEILVAWFRNRRTLPPGIDAAHRPWHRRLRPSREWYGSSSLI
jgi:hypothetical protein